MIDANIQNKTGTILENKTGPSDCNHELRGFICNPQKCLSRLSDQDLRKVFYERFELKTSEVITCSSKAAYHLSALLINTSQEKFGVIFLNGRNAFIHSDVLFEGTLTTTAVYQREIIKRALDLNAAAIIIGHNHPSGSVSPSPYDQEVTETIKRACEAIGIRLHDHLIVGYDNWFSFSDHHML